MEVMAISRRLRPIRKTFRAQYFIGRVRSRSRCRVATALLIPLWRRLKSEGRLLAESSGNNTSDSLNFVPRMDPARLVEGYQAILRTIYSPGEYYGRALECLKRVSQEGPEPQHHSLISGIVAFARIALKLGILDRERREFWRFFRRAASEHRDELAQSMRLEAMGFTLSQTDRGLSRVALLAEICSGAPIFNVHGHHLMGKGTAAPRPSERGAVHVIAGQTTCPFHRPFRKTTALTTASVEKAIVMARKTPCGPSPSMMAST